MNKLVLGFVSSGLFLLCGLFQLVANNIWLGLLFIVVSIASIILHIRLNRKSKG